MCTFKFQYLKFKTITSNYSSSSLAYGGFFQGGGGGGANVECWKLCQEKLMSRGGDSDTVLSLPKKFGSIVSYINLTSQKKNRIQGGMPPKPKAPSPQPPAYAPVRRYWSTRLKSMKMSYTLKSVERELKGISAPPPPLYAYGQIFSIL